MADSLFLGIESSCDDSSVALLAEDGTLVRLLSQAHLEALQPFGGVMPEVVSREHGRVLPLLLAEICRDLDFSRLKAVAFTAGPGLPGSLLIGSHCARTLSLVKKIPLLPIHHLEGHLLAYELEHPPLPYPYVALIVSGGHTQLVMVRAPFSYEIIGKTRDDAAGEAYDKVAKILGFAYPGGPALANLADHGQDLKLLTRPLTQDKTNLDMSFSGLKTQARTIWESFDGKKEDFCASVQAAINDTLVLKLQRCLEQFPEIQGIDLCGGVACNKDLRKKVEALCTESQRRWACASPKFCADNAAMIAISGLRHWQLDGPALKRDIDGCRSVWPLDSQD